MKSKKFMWFDLTVDDARVTLDFYVKVLGWEYSEHPMGDYVDFNIIDPSTSEVFTGICHKKGNNSKIPNCWLNYVSVEDIDKTVDLCIRNNGKIIDGPRKMGGGIFAVIQDPQGAFLALYQDN